MRTPISLLVIAFAAVGCAPTETRLEPAGAPIQARPDTRQLDEDTVVDRAGDVSVKAEVDTWPGDPGVLRHVTPVRVSIKNESDHPVRIQYRRFQLVSRTGERYRALPPFQIEGSIREPVLVDPYGVADRDLYYPGFYVDPLYRDVWPGLAPYDPLHDYDPAYYGSTWGYWRRPLPTAEMRRRVLPEGVVEPGGRVSGFLYFERPPEDTGLVRLVSELVDARTGRRFATSRIPFRVEG